MGSPCLVGKGWVETPMAARIPRPLERSNLRDFRRYLAFHGCRVWRRNAGMVTVEKGGRRYRVRGAPAGQSDLWRFLPGPKHAHFECEVKREGAWPTRLQIEWLIEINILGHYGFWADSIERLDRIFRGIVAGKRVVVEPSGDLYLDDGRG
jgi:hypothetical protein